VTGTARGAAATIAALLAGVDPGCSRQEGAERPSPRVLLETPTGTAVVSVEVARTPEARERGLMGRSHLDPDAGMIFLFDLDEPHGFWMKNTLIPLDILFIGEDGRVAAITERQPLSLEVEDGGVASRYVLEVNGGWARQHRVKPGDRVRFENVLY